jgi:murein DD-endopeptidase MepM/ murein hydrolase activator NlpD
MKKSMLFDERFISFSALVLGVLIFFFYYKSSDTKAEDLEASVPSPVVAAKLEQVLSIEEEFPHVIKRNIALYSYLSELEVPSLDIIEMVNASKAKKDLSKLTPGTRFQIKQGVKKNLEEIKVRFSAVEKLEVKKIKGKWDARIVEELVDIQSVSFVGKVENSLWESALNSKMDPYLIVAMSEIFGWEVDFNREVRLGDKWRITAEKKLVKGQHVGWGSVLAAEYVNSGESHKAVLFRHEGEDVGYYDLKGESLRKMFLKSPLRFGRVTSRFNKRRFHPKLKIIRPHNGVDLGAPTGTPVRAVADGTVTFSKYRGGGGKTLKLRHNSKYKTAYKHLSRFGKGIRPGVKVKQGQVVAYVGSTGLSTGPHLHYEFFINNRFVDPLRQKFPSADPVSPELKLAFLKQSKKMAARLPSWTQKNFVLQASQKTWTQEYAKPVETKPIVIFGEQEI